MDIMDSVTVMEQLLVSIDYWKLLEITGNYWRCLIAYTDYVLA